MNEETISSAEPPHQIPLFCWSSVILPALLALTGIMTATIAAKMGQASAYDHALTGLRYHIAVVEADIAQKQLQEEHLTAQLRAQIPLAPGPNNNPLQAQLDALHKKIVAQQVELQVSNKSLSDGRVSSYVMPGRHFTSWDAYRYEEIIDSGYLYHMPADPDNVRNSPIMNDPHTGERRLKNVGWYPLYPLLGVTVKFLSGLPKAILTDWHNVDGFFWKTAQQGMATVDALTLVSRVCCVLAAIVFFVLARNHYEISAAMVMEDEHYRLSSYTAALWALAFLFFTPTSIFLYSNFTESLFALLLASFLLCLQRRWWWRAAVVAAIAAGCRSQGVLFGPILALCYLFQGNAWLPWRLSKAAILGVISSVGIAAYMYYLHVKFGDALAFAHVQAQGWGAGIGKDALMYAVNPMHAWDHFWHYLTTPPTDWPRVYESFCVFAPPVLLIIGWRYLSAQQMLVAIVLWLLPYISTAWMAYPEGPVDHWVSMGRYMAVCIPLQIILGGLVSRYRIFGFILLPLAAAIFGVFAFLHGTSAWLG